MNWQPIETAPINVPILIHYKTSYGRSCIIKARFVPKFTEETEFAEWGEYEEETDIYYNPAGWYEMIDNWEEFSTIFVNEGVPDFWMPLPEPPK